MVDCRVLKALFRGNARKKPRNDKNAGCSNDPPRQPDDDEDDVGSEPDPRHTYNPSARTIAMIFGGKVALETGRERKLLARVVMNVAKQDDKIADPKYHT
jgi:hypothetical protein